MDQDFLLSIFRYFARFVPDDTLKKMMVSADYAALQGANEALVEQLKSNDRADADIDAYIFSGNPDFVSDQMRNSTKTVLFVEYGQTSYDGDGLSVAVDIAITIATPYNKSNRDNLNELLTVNSCQNKLINILSQMKADSDASCACGKFRFPADIQPIEPSAFYSRVGFVAFVRVINPVADVAALPSELFDTESSYGQSLLANYYTKAQCDLRFALKSEIPSVKAGFLSLWNAVTGLPTVPPESGYAYKTGDMLIVGNVATGSISHHVTLIGQSTEGLYEGVINYDIVFDLASATASAFTTIAQISAAIEELGSEVFVPATGTVTLEDGTEINIAHVISWGGGTLGLVQEDGQKACIASGTPTTLTDNVTGSTTNYKPSGATYQGASSVVETSVVKKGDTYYYDGSAWNLQIDTLRTEIDDSSTATDKTYSASKISSTVSAINISITALNAAVATKATKAALNKLKPLIYAGL